MGPRTHDDFVEHYGLKPCAGAVYGGGGNADGWRSVVFFAASPCAQGSTGFHLCQGGFRGINAGRALLDVLLSDFLLRSLAARRIIRQDLLLEAGGIRAKIFGFSAFHTNRVS